MSSASLHHGASTTLALVTAPKGHDQSAVELAAYDATPDDTGNYQP